MAIFDLMLLFLSAVGTVDNDPPVEAQVDPYIERLIAVRAVKFLPG
jgi:hypothetical protein